MECRFQDPRSGSRGVLKDVELVFDEGALRGMKLVGLAVRENRAGEAFVTFPSRSYQQKGEMRYWDFLRADDGSRATVDQLKGWVLGQFKERFPQLGTQVPNLPSPVPTASREVAAPSR